MENPDKSAMMVERAKYWAEWFLDISVYAEALIDTKTFA